METTDIALASYLLCKNCSLSTIKVAGRQGTFVFENVSPELIKEFNFGGGLVEPVAFHTNLKRLSTSVRRVVTGGV